MRTVPIIILLISVTTLFAANISAKYEVEHSFLGKMADAYVMKDVHDNVYTIELSIETTGLAAGFSDNLVKRFISQGTIQKGRFIPDILTVVRHNDIEESYIVYRFDHQTKRIDIDNSAKTEVTTRVLRPMSLSFDEKKETEYTHESHLCDTYVRDDIITLFFNAKNYIDTSDNHEEHTVLAAGIDNDEEDNIDGILGFGISYEDMQQILESSTRSEVISVALSEKIFDAKDKHLLIDINVDTLPQSVQLDDVAFGDVNIKRVFDNVGSL